VTFAAQIERVDILFPGLDHRAARSRVEAALRALDAGKSRSEIIDETGIVVGASDVSLTIARGEIFVIMGLSGSGKTTVLRAMNGLNTISRGRIVIRHGENLVDMSNPAPTVLRRLRNEAISMVFQQFALLPWRTVRRNVELGLELRRMPRAEMRKTVDGWLDLVGLLPWAEKHAHELSGGMQQRVGLARALATNADILLMDEPFSALDPLIRNKLQDELLSLQRSVRKTILFVTHDLDEALKLGSQIAIMKDGRVVQVGKPEDIVLRPATDYVAEFVRHMNPLTAVRAASLMRPISEIATSGGACHFVDRAHYQIRLDAEGRLAAIHCDGVAMAWQEGGANGAAEQGGISIVDADQLLKDIVELRQQSGHPVLVSAGGRIVGCCGSDEIFAALTHAGRSEFRDSVAAVG
jgi:glycine betaine/proline transport system ATP-binding protein